MKFASLVLKNAFRSKRRTVLTALGVGVTLSLIILMVSFLARISEWRGTGGSRRCVVMSKAGLGADLPMSHIDHLHSLPQVERVMRMQWFGGVYRDPRNFFANFAVDMDQMTEIWPENSLVAGSIEDALSTPQGAIAGIALMDRFGWRVGDTITLQGTIFPVNLDLRILAVYQDNRGHEDDNLYFQFEYFREAAQQNAVGTFWLQCRTAEDIPSVMRDVDDHFANSPFPTRTMTEEQFGQMFVSMMGNLEALFRNLGALIVVMLLFVTGNTMAMAVRERTTEIAVMKALGFTPGRIVGLVIAESILVSLLGVALAVGVSYGLLALLGNVRGSMFSNLTVYPQAVGAAAAVGLFVGLVSGAIPAMRSARLKVVDGLRRVG